MDASGRSPKAAAKIVRDALAKCEALDALQGRTFYAVGGTWRSLAKLRHGSAPLPADGHARLQDAGPRSGGTGRTMCSRRTRRRLPRFESVNAARRPLLAYGAVVLEELIRRARPKDVVISTYGVREGLLYEQLDPARRGDDPLLVAAPEAQRSCSPARPAMPRTCWTGRRAFLARPASRKPRRSGACAQAACLFPR